MDIRPVDMQLVVNKAADVNKIHDNMRQNTESQQMFAEQFTKEAQRQDQRTVNLQKGEDQNISDGKGNKNKDNYRKRRKRKSAEEEEKIKKEMGGSIFDVSI